MSTAPDKRPWTRWLVTLGVGTIAGAAIWLVGAPDVAFLGYVVTAMVREPLPRRSCRAQLRLRRAP